MALIQTHIASAVLGMDVTCQVILPQKASKLIGMETAAGEGLFPVLWLLHGMSDDETIWQRRTSIERYAAPLGLAVVMPAVQLSGYADMAHGGRYYTFISKELPELMANLFPFSRKREDNFIAGLSMGGAGCMKIGLANPEQNSAIGCLSAGMINRGADSPQRRARMEMLYGGRDITGTEEDPVHSARQILEKGLPAPRIYHACGDDDFLLDSAHETRDFFQSMEGNPFDYTYEQDPGVHSWEFWDEHIQHFLRFLKLQPEKDVRN